MNSAMTTVTPAPSTPSRPARSIHRLSTHSTVSSITTLVESPPPLPSTPSQCSRSPLSEATLSPTSPRTPTISSPEGSQFRLVSPNSYASLRRKPVPFGMGDIPVKLDSFPSPTTRPIGISGSSRPRSHPITPRTPNDPPTYVLPVDPPASPPAYPSISTDHLPPVQRINVDTGLHSEPRSTEDLPRYTPEGETEPKTLARSLWRWGWLFPFLWAIGMCILWIPLRSEEQEEDPEKAQKLEEMIVILREAELKYARRCMYAFCGFVTLLVTITVIAVVLSKIL